MITERTAHGLTAEDVSSSTQKYAELFLFADALGRARFLKRLADDGNPLTKDRKDRVDNSKRRLGKVCQYASGVSHLIQRAKRLFLIPTVGSRTLSLARERAYSTFVIVLTMLYRVDSTNLGQTRQALSFHSQLLGKAANFARMHPCRTSYHPPPWLPPLDSPVHPIGISKRSCFCCVLWIESHNRVFGTRWRSHGKPYANWALPAAACSYAIGADGRSSVDEAVLEAVLIRLADALGWLFPGQKKISDEHVSSGDESSGDEQGASEWRRRIVTLAHPPRG